MNDTLIKDAVYASIAQSVLDSLDSDIKEQVLKRAVESVLSGYRFEHVISEAIQERASKVSAELAASGQWDASRQVIEESFEDYLRYLKQALPDLIISVLHGSQSKSAGYSSESAGLIVRRLKSKEDK